jgi:hypothetical protein
MTKFRAHFSSLACAGVLALSAAAAHAQTETAAFYFGEIVVNGTPYGVNIAMGDGSVRLFNDSTSTRTLWVNTGQAKVQLLCKGRNCTTADGQPFPVPPNAPTTTLSNGQTVVQIGMLIPAVLKADWGKDTTTPYPPAGPAGPSGPSGPSGPPAPAGPSAPSNGPPMDDMPPPLTAAKPGPGLPDAPHMPTIKDGANNTFFVGESRLGPRRAPSAKLKAPRAK